MRSLLGTNSEIRPPLVDSLFPVSKHYKITCGRAGIIHYFIMITPLCIHLVQTLQNALKNNEQK